MDNPRPEKVAVVAEVRELCGELDELFEALTARRHCCAFC